jgi:hypothetical protein
MTAKRATTRSLLAFEVPSELCRRTEEVIEAIRKSADPQPHAQELIEVIIELTRTGLDSYFLLPLKRARVGSVNYGSAKLGVAAAGKSLPVLVRKVVGSVSSEQLLEIVDFLDQILVVEESSR